MVSIIYFLYLLIWDLYFDTASSWEYDLDTSQSDNEQNNMKENQISKKKKMICQFFFLVIFLTWSSALPLRIINHKVLLPLIRQVCEALRNLHLIQIKYKFFMGSIMVKLTCMLFFFFCTIKSSNWLGDFNSHNDNKPIWWLSDYP